MAEQQNIRILHLEDDPRDAAMIQDLLETAGLSCDFVTVDNKDEFESALRTGSFDIILSDFSLPGYDGLTALKRTLELQPGVPVIVVSGELSEVDAVACLHLGAADYLLKQRLDRLGTAVRRALAAAEEQRKRINAEEEFRASEERFRQLAQHSSEGFWFVSLNPERIEYVSPAVEKIWGLPAERFYEDARSWLSAIHSDDQTRVQEAWEACLNGQSARIETEYRVVRPDESIRWIYDSGIPIRNDDGEIVRVAGVARDLTERKHTEAEMNRLVAAVEQTGDSIVITDINGNIQYVNPAFERITGYSEVEALGQKPRILKSGKTDPSVYRNLWETITRGEVWTGQLTNRRKDGTLFEEHVTISPVRDSSGQITNYIAVKQDTTVQNQLELQLQQSQKLEAIGLLAGGVAHDFNNMLTVISGYTDLSLMKLKEDDPIRHNLHEVKSASARAASLTRQLLAFSRKQILEPSILDLNAVVSNLNKMLERLIGEDVDLCTQLASDLGRVKADPGQIEQIVMNLVVNARDAMPSGGRVTIETANVDLDDKYAQEYFPTQPGPYVMLAISDTGTGIDAETRARIFEPFFTTKETGKGTGLGLSTVYGIVKQSGGLILVFSELNRGTTFKVYLPRLTEGVEQKPAETSRPAAPRGTGTILLVEDESQVGNITAQFLEMAGYEVVRAGDGHQALEVAAGYKKKIDLVITDVVMPRISGRELAERLAELRPETRVLFMSGYTDDAMVRHGITDKDIAFLPKPFTSDSLIRKVAEMLHAAEVNDRR